jgi:hypothetical protein
MSEHDARPQDERLVERLRAAATRFDPVPPEIDAAARAAFTWRTIDAELAALAYDSVLDADLLVGVRGQQGPRMLTFEAAGLTAELEVVVSDGRRRLVGQLVPPGPARIGIRHRGGELTVDADDLGRFAVDGVERGPVSLRIDAQAGAVAVHTDWVNL